MVWLRLRLLFSVDVCFVACLVFCVDDGLFVVVDVGVDVHVVVGGVVYDFVVVVMWLLMRVVCCCCCSCCLCSCVVLLLRS